MINQAHEIMLESMPEGYQAAIKARVKEISLSITHEQIDEFHNRASHLLGANANVPHERYRNIKIAETWLAERELETRSKTLPNQLVDKLVEAAHAAKRGGWDKGFDSKGH